MLTKMHFNAGKVVSFPEWLKLKKIRIFFLISARGFSKTQIKSIFTLLLLFVFSILTGFGQNDTDDARNKKADKSKKRFALFGSDELLEISLQFDLTTFLKKNLVCHIMEDLFRCFITFLNYILSYPTMKHMIYLVVILY